MDCPAKPFASLLNLDSLPGEMGMMCLPICMRVSIRTTHGEAKCLAPGACSRTCQHCTCHGGSDSYLGLCCPENGPHNFPPALPPTCHPQEPGGQNEAPCSPRTWVCLVPGL